MGAAQSNFRGGSSILAGASHLDELGPDISYEKSISTSRFLKAIKARHRHGAIVVKVFVKWDAHMDLRPTSKRITVERAALTDCPNLLPYAHALATERAGYLLRQWVGSNLYDRISTRPFLSLIEKKWISFQLLMALKDMHTHEIYHGDIKSENVLVTSWNWIYLADLAANFKPPYLPEDDPADFSYFFDTSGRRSCFLAPERFYKADSEWAAQKAKLPEGRRLGHFTAAMDVFSAGCVIAELFVETSPPFTLSQLFKFRTGEYDLTSYLRQIEDEGIRNLILNMTALRADDRLSAQQYLADSYGSTFPTAFYDFFHVFIADLNDLGSVWSVAASERDRGPPTVRAPGNTSNAIGSPETTVYDIATNSSMLPYLSHADDIISRIASDFGHIQRYFVEGRNATPAVAASDIQQTMPISADCFPIQSCLQGFVGGSVQSASIRTDGCATLLLDLLCANIRNCVQPSSILQGLDLVLALLPYLTDDIKLDRLAPYLSDLLQNEQAPVRVHSLKTLTHMLSGIELLLPANATIFQDFILSKISPLCTDADETVRAAFAQCLASLAQAGLRFLDLAQSLKGHTSFKLSRHPGSEQSTFEMTYDAWLADLQDVVKDHIDELLKDPSHSVRQALMHDICQAGVVLGRTRTSEVFGFMTTHLNDKNWRLRYSFFEAAVGMATCMGSTEVNSYVLPLMTESLLDAEETVSTRKISTLAILAELGLYNRLRVWDLLPAMASLCLHPNTWLRVNAVRFIAVIAGKLSPADSWCRLRPLVREVLQADVDELSEEKLLQALQQPATRVEFENAVDRASRYFTDSAIIVHGDSDRDKSNKSAALKSKEQASAKGNRLQEIIKDTYGLRANVNQRDVTIDDILKLMVGEEVAVASLGATAHTIILSSANPVSLTLPRHVALFAGSRRSSHSASPSGFATPIQRPSQSRTASISSHADGFRRQLASRNSSAVHLVDQRQGTAPSAVAAATDAQLRLSGGHGQGQVQQDYDKAPEKVHASLASGISVSLPAVVPPSSVASATLLQRGLLGVNGVGAAKVAPAVASDLSPATGTVIKELSDSVSGISGPYGQTSQRHSNVAKTVQRFESTYDGNDPRIKQLVDRAFLDSNRDMTAEFGDFVPAKAARKRLLRVMPRDKSPKRPEGNLIAHLFEHTGAVTSLAVSPDHLFFASGSEDGSVKIWDCLRLEKNVSSRARQTIRQGGCINSVISLQNTHCIATASTNGSLWISRIDSTSTAATGVPRYGKPALIRQHQVQQEHDYITCMVHHVTDSSSQIIYATSLGKLVTLDIRSLRTIDTRENPAQYGSISCMCIDRKCTWLLLGTTAGWLCLWDLRFSTLVQQWQPGGYGSSQAIRSLTLHRSRGKGRWVMLARDEVSGFEVWEVDTARKVESFELTGPGSGRGRADTASSYSSLLTNQPSATEGLGSNLAEPADAIAKLIQEDHRIAPEHVPALKSPRLQSASPDALHILQHHAKSSGTRVMLIGTDYANTHESAVLAVGSLAPLSETHPSIVESGSSASSREAYAHNAFIISGGDDCKLRFWDLANIEKSCVVSGLVDEEERPAYSVIRRSTFSGNMGVYLETSSANKSVFSGSGKRSQIIAANQQRLSRAHQDTISAIALIELPFRCIVSADRSGIIKVWQ